MEVLVSSRKNTISAIQRLYSTSGLSGPFNRSAAGPKRLWSTQLLAGVSSFLCDLSFALAAARLPPSSGSRAHDLLGDVVAPQVGGAHVAAGDLDAPVAGLAHDVVELRLGRRGGEPGAQAVARVAARRPDGEAAEGLLQKPGVAVADRLG